jgi:hypothetical protein
MGKIAGLGVALAAVALAGQAMAAEDHLWAKPGATEAAVSKDLEACEKEAHRVAPPLPGPTTIVVRGGVGNLAAAGAVGFLMEAYLTRHEVPAVVGEGVARRCMRRAGYVWLALEPDEVDALKHAHQEKVAWIDKFYAGDLAARLEAAGKPAVPPLPEDPSQALTFDGLRFDPTHLTTGKGVIGDGGVVLSGTVEVQRTATLKQAVTLTGLVAGSVDAGAMFYEVTGPAAYSRDQTYWCGPFHISSLVGQRTWMHCLTTSDTGYQLWAVRNGPPFAGPPLPAIEELKTPGLDFSLVPTDKPLIGPYKFKITASYINFYDVRIEADVIANGHTVRVWDVPLAYAQDGTAVVPFWTHRLVLHRILGQGVTAELRPDGDGKGWLDAKLAD